MKKVVFFFKCAFFDLLKACYLLLDEVLIRFEKNVFCFLFNLRSLIFGWKIRFSFSKQQKKYIAKSGALFQYFLNKRQALNAYRISLHHRSNYMNSIYHLHEIQFSEGDIVVDCGANVGDLNLFFKSKNLKIDYIGFEPSPSEFSCLELNVQSGKLFNNGLWNGDSHLDFYVSSNGADSSFIKPRVFDEIRKVKTVRLDSVLPTDLKITLFKLEAEGAEIEVIQGAEKILPNIKYISADLGFERGVSEESTLCPVANYLLSKNFELVRIANGRLVSLFRNKSYVQ